MNTSWLYAYCWRSSVLFTGGAILLTLIAPELSRLEAPWRQTDATTLSTTFLAAALVLLAVAVLAARRKARTWQQSEEMFRSLVERAQDPMFTLDAAGRCLYVNPTGAGRLGKTQAEVAGRFVDEFFPPENAAQHRKLVGEALSTGKSSTTEVTVNINGQRLWFSVLVQPLRDPGGGYTSALVISRDITDRMRAEIALRENVERLRQVIRLSHIGIFDHYHLTGAIYCSPEQREIFGLTPDEEVILRDTAGRDPREYDFRDSIHPLDRERTISAAQRSHESADGLFDIEYRIIRRDGAVRWLSTRAQTFFEGTGAALRPVRTIGAVQDITERKRAERQLLLTQTSIDKSSVAIFWINPSAEIMYVNEQAGAGLGRACVELTGCHVWDIDPDLTPEEWAGIWRHIKEHGSLRLERRHRRKDGSTFPIEVTGSYVVYEGEEQMFVFSQDITERKRAEESLALFRDCTDRSSDAIFWNNASGGFDYVNEHACRSLGYTREELLRLKFWDIDDTFPEERWHRLWKKWESASDDSTGRTLSLHRHKNGATFPIEAVGQHIRTQAGHSLQVGYVRDITDRKRAEQALLESEERLKQVALVYNIGVFDHDHTSDTVYWSPELREYLELPPGAVALPTDFRPLVHPEDLEKVEAAVRQAHDPAGDGRYAIQHRIVTPSGSLKWLDTRSKTFFAGEPGARYPRRTVGAMVDITARMEAAEALRVSVREKETLLREVHHRVKNNLQIISSVLHFHAKKVKNPEDLVVFNEARNRLRAIILVHERLYKSTGLARIDFRTYIQAFVHDLWRSYAQSASGRISVHVAADPVELPIESALPCGMIVCELLTNSIKYAFPGERRGEIRVALSTADGRVTLSVNDDGIGLPADFDPARSPTFGWQLIRNLAAQLDATLTATGGNTGTQVALLFTSERSQP
jgi:PAS domain S-box-containing protein